MKVLPADASWLNYHHLRYFHTVAAEGSLRLAAEKLRISQPSISTQIKVLEAALGERLFRRSGRSLVLTEFGRVVQTYATDIFALGRNFSPVPTAALPPVPCGCRSALWTPFPSF